MLSQVRMEDGGGQILGDHTFVQSLSMKVQLIYITEGLDEVIKQSYVYGEILAGNLYPLLSFSLLIAFLHRCTPVPSLSRH